MAALAITFVLLLLLGAPIFYAVAISASAFVVFTGSNTLSIISQKMVDGTVSTTLLALPLFIYSGNLMSGGCTKRLMNFADMLLGKIPGGLGTAAVACCFLRGGLR
ncbi:MAG: TRAP transporter large permease subunit [Oscillospiraceae bacterium]